MHVNGESPAGAKAGHLAYGPYGGQCGKQVNSGNVRRKASLLSSNRVNPAPFGDATTGYATVRGSLQRTTDGGAHWTAIKTPGT